ncbi:MAG: hypothetical protein EOP61_22515, partial [Sphingomonadales bacterium]
MRVSLIAGVAALALAACATTEMAEAPAAPVAAAAAASPAAQAAPNSEAFARVVELGSGVSMLVGQGGNLGVSVGDDGVFLIDDQYASNAAVNLAKIEQLTKGKPKYLINTHWHFD